MRCNKAFGFLLLSFLLLSVLSGSVAAKMPKEAVKSEKTEMRIALSFDDGPHPKKTMQILDILKEYDIPATFFVIGQNAALYPEPLRRAVREGHEIGNHTYTHPHMSGVSTEELREEILRCTQTIEDVAGVTPRLFRPPEGNYTEEDEGLLEELSLTGVLWSVDTEDWAGKSEREIIKTVKKEIDSGKIILFHDYIGHKNATVEALQRLIPYLLERGYRFCTVSELFE